MNAVSMQKHYKKRQLKLRLPDSSVEYICIKILGLQSKTEHASQLVLLMTGGPAILTKVMPTANENAAAAAYTFLERLVGNLEIMSGLFAKSALDSCQNCLQVSVVRLRLLTSTLRSTTHKILARQTFLTIFLFCNCATTSSTSRQALTFTA